MVLNILLGCELNCLVEATLYKIRNGPTLNPCLDFLQWRTVTWKYKLYKAAHLLSWLFYYSNRKKLEQHMWKRYPLEQMMLENKISTYIERKLDLCHSSCTKISSKRIKDFNVRLEALNLLEENIMKVFQHTGIWTNSKENSSSSGKHAKKWQVELHAIKKFLFSAGSENTTYRVGERFHPAIHQKKI